MASNHRKIAKLVEICYDALPKHRGACEYLKQRQISQKTIDKFYLGAFPADLRVLLKEFDSKFLLENGIVYNASKSPFRNNPLIIPIWDANDEFIGIAGRTLASAQKQKALGYLKYINTRYDKANHLFGLNYAKQFIRTNNYSIVVEGYFDVISSHQAGMTNVVATAGVYLSERQILLLSRYGEKIKLLFDNDERGKAGAERYLKNSVNGVELQGLVLPDGYKDIDEYIVKSGNKLEIT